MQNAVTAYRPRRGGWLAVTLALLLAADAWGAVELQLDRDRAMVGETVTLTFITDETGQNLETDFSPLEQDFDILDSRREQRLSIVNNQQAAEIRLVLIVEPKRAGDIKIPSFRFGQSVTEPTTLKVEPAPELADGELPPVFIEVEVTPENGPYYVLAQFGLVVRVLYHPNLTEAAISQPDPAPASVRLLEETPYHAERGGKRYRVLERHYAVFPERSGELVVPAMELTGRLMESQSSGIWQPTVRGRRVRASSEEIRLNVVPRPPEFTGSEWLPARSVQLSQQISSGEELRVGEPVTRTVMVDAVGLEENMIVEPAWPEIEKARIYPDQPQGITRDDGRWVRGHKEFRYAVVPEEPGELVLPEIRLDWWDTQADEQRTAILQSRSLVVKPADLAPPPVTQPPPPNSSGPAPALAPGAGTAPLWKWIALGFAGLWLATLLLAWRLVAALRGGIASTGSAATVSGDERALLKTIRQACRANDAGSARRALQNWLSNYGPDGGASLLEFAARSGDPELRDALYALDARGFRPGGQSAWDGGDALWRQFRAWRRQSATGAGAEAPLTDLYAPENRPGPQA